MARRIALSGVRLAVKRPAMRRPCQRRRMRRVGPGVAGILRYKVSGKTPAIAAVRMRAVWPRVWLPDMRRICALAARRKKKIRCDDRPSIRGESWVRDKYERKLAAARSVTMVADSAKE